MVTGEELQQWGDLRKAARTVLRCLHVTAMKLTAVPEQDPDTWASGVRLTAAEAARYSSLKSQRISAGIKHVTKTLGT